MLRSILLRSPVMNRVLVQETDQDQTKIMLTNILIRIPVINWILVQETDQKVVRYYTMIFQTISFKVLGVKMQPKNTILWTSLVCVEIQQAPINDVITNRMFSHLIKLNKMSLARYINGIWIKNKYRSFAVRYYRRWNSGWCSTIRSKYICSRCLIWNIKYIHQNCKIMWPDFI